ncbi:MAG TPA: Flp pilus assembly protein CpaB [Acidiphilium sp.]|nr:MAG: Flp pilus assembly protein CpaB [Acidiphilium sp. 21-60-14]OYV91285.1 MAG: Flp pilus assembly protein CpaB [Acidiphilium sp. 37-60-79]OZB40749.1 MAG: Flp pilus assembly protein CpaB [Acidiphilium sp. 34-60-192]HQT88814.1 Flp pilus assembly protein CpaB [Acidiphilium sp.]HQU23720.1 Flp pilus assembly protein CpaB [Acidiphilium sp.]
MIVRLTLLTLLAIGLAGFGTVAWLDLHPARPKHMASRPVQLLAVAHALHAGSLIQPADLTAVIDTGKIPPGAVIDSAAARSAYTGAMVRDTLAPGALIKAGIVIRPGDHGFLAAVLHPGMRAVSVGVDAISGTAGLIWPGDRVDLILTQSLDGPGINPGHRVAAETVLADVRVIAIDQRLVQGADASGKAPAPARTVTLEVSPDQAERVEVAAHLGPLSLVVRSSSLPARQRLAIPAPVYGSQVSPVLAQLTPGPHRGGEITVYQGPAQQIEFRP